MKTVWKYPININDKGELTLNMPQGAEMLAIRIQNGSPHLWALVNPENEKEDRNFRIFGTGHSIDDPYKMFYVGTFAVQSGTELVFHVFEVVA